MAALPGGHFFYFRSMKESFTDFPNHSDLLTGIRSQVNQEAVAEIDKAYEYARTVCKEITPGHQENELHHSLKVALVVVDEIGLGVESAVSALLFPTLTQTSGEERDALLVDVKKRFGPAIATMLEGIGKINALGTGSAELHSENFRRLMLALAGDVRVIILKIADRLQVMREHTIRPNERSEAIAIETQHLYAPLAHRLGLYKINSELQDLYLRFTRTEAWQEIEDQLNKTRQEREAFTAEFVRPIDEKLRSKGFRFEMKARTKSVFSIWNKMQKQKVSFDEVYDLFAIRIILESEPQNEKSDCWMVYSIITDEYQTNPERLRDWITIPKSNGYESLHTTVMGPHKKWVEVQVRTRRMDEVAEKGLAAHWKYKGGKGASEFDQWLTGIREILENPEVNVVDFIDEFRKNVYTDEIFVFTPRGDLKKLPQGATVLDFAYEIHSDIGDHCAGGKINDRKVTIRQKLKNGDTISIETANNQRPKSDWLDCVVTSKAKNRIRATLNEAQKREADNGKEILIRKFKNWKLDLSDEVMRKLLKHFNFKTAAELYIQIGKGKIDTLDIKAVLREESRQNVSTRLQEILSPDSVKELPVDHGDDYLIVDNNIGNVNYRLAPCCNPVFGDEIFGFVTIREGIKIHRVNCPNAVQMIERYPYRIIKSRWRDTSSKSSFLTSLYITGADSLGIVSEISHVIAKDFGVQMRSINVESNRGEFQGNLKVLVHSVEHLDFLMHKLKNIKGITSVTRGDT